MFRSTMRLPEGRRFGARVGFVGRHNAKRMRHVISESLAWAASLELLGCANIWIRALILATVTMDGGPMVASGEVVSVSVTPTSWVSGDRAKVIFNTGGYLKKVWAGSLGYGYPKGAEKPVIDSRICTQEGWLKR